MTSIPDQSLDYPWSDHKRRDEQERLQTHFNHKFKFSQARLNVNVSNVSFTYGTVHSLNPANNHGVPRILSVSRKPAARIS